MRTLYQTPTWEQAEEDSVCREGWNEYAAIMDPRQMGPEPTPLGELIHNWYLWIGHHARYWRCVVGPHAWGKWLDLYDHPEYVEDGYRLPGCMTGRVRTCTRCGTQDGRGEY